MFHILCMSYCNSHEVKKIQDTPDHGVHEHLPACGLVVQYNVVSVSYQTHEVSQQQIVAYWALLNHM